MTLSDTPLPLQQPQEHKRTATAAPGDATLLSNATRYLQKHQRLPLQIPIPPSPHLGLSVVIPCHDEPALLTTLEALWRCQRPRCHVEVLIVINASETDDAHVHRRNQETYADASRWIAQHQAPELTFHLLNFPRLKPRDAGVGLARKLGMDEAVARFCKIGNPRGIIACLDADCECAPNYLSCLEAHFARYPKTPGCSIYFEHLLTGNGDTRLDSGIIRYELYLRYYVQGLRFSDFPYAYHTLGSCMAVRSDVYAKQGGMNRRQGGEDFYFLHKIIPLGNFTEICDTRVFPSARASHRVPFGTGKAQRQWLANEETDYKVYSPQVFFDLKALFSRIDEFRTAPLQELAALDRLPDAVAIFLQQQHFSQKLAEMQKNTASVDTFKKRFLHWFNAFRVLKFVHWATDHSYPKQPLVVATSQLLVWQGLEENQTSQLNDAKALLDYYRRMQRNQLPY